MRWWVNVFAVLAIVGLAFSVPLGFCVGEAEAGEAVVDAQNRVIVCYNAVADASRVGANVTGLLSVLEGAGGLLSEAVAAADGGNYSSAVGLANQCVTSLVGFEGTADALVKAAEMNGFVDFAVNVGGSLTGALAVVLVGVVLWGFLKKKYP